MKELLKKYNIILNKNELSQFNKFLKIFQEKNSQINLSAIRDTNSIIEKHFIDSIMLNVFIELNGKICDVGTGGGFPLIPLAITNPNIDFLGIDSINKKINSIDYFINELGLKNVKTKVGRIEDIGRDFEYREQFNFVTSRATAYLPTLIEYTIPLLKIGGILAAYKLEDKDELGISKKALKKLGAKILKVKNYLLEDQNRVIIFIEKLEKTNKRYPRKNGTPLSKPII